MLMQMGIGALAALVLAAAPHASAQRRAPGVRGPTPGSATAAALADQGATSPAEGVVNIQTASMEELQRLPGIGPAKAAAIVAYRERTPFRRVEDILRVRGIGRATFRRLRPMLTVSGPTTLREEVRRSRVHADFEEDGDEVVSQP
jgi:competence protein ComEA